MCIEIAKEKKFAIKDLSALIGQENGIIKSMEVTLTKKFPYNIL